MTRYPQKVNTLSLRAIIAAFNDLVDLITPLLKLTVGGGLALKDTPGGKVITAGVTGTGTGDASASFWAEITGYEGTLGGLYYWRKVDYPGALGTTGDTGSARNAEETTIGYCHAYKPVPVGRTVRMYETTVGSTVYYYFVSDNHADYGDPATGRDALVETQGAQNTDDWAIETDGGPDGDGVEVQYLTDLSYNPATHILSYRVRTGKYDQYGRLVAITGEGNLVTVTTAVECPA